MSRTLYFVVHYFLNNKICSLNEINMFILNFPYGYSELKDKPVAITLEDLKTPSDNLGQTAAQIWLLSRVFVFFGEEYAHLCPAVWRVLMTSLEITAICLSRKISINILGYLKGLIKEHLQLFRDIIGENITPKQHYLVHVPSQILKFGPLVRAWAMRFEAKHQQFKKIPKITKNFKNLPKTLPERHQNGVLADSLPLSGDKAVSANDHPLFRKELLVAKDSTYTKLLVGVERGEAKRYISRFSPNVEEFTSELPLYQAASVTIHGTCFKQDRNTILLAELKDSNPVFGSIEKIWLFGTYVSFGLKLYDTVDFAANLNAYRIKEELLPGGLLIIEAQHLLLPSVMHIYNHNGNQYICPREDLNALED